MPREDKTFTASDIVRLWCNNLDKNEQIWTTVFFLIIVPGIILTEDQIQRIFHFISELVPSKTTGYIIRIIARSAQLLRKIANKLWAKIIFGGPMRIEVERCIDKMLAKPPPKKRPPPPPPS